MKALPLDAWELMGYAPSPWAAQFVHTRDERYRAYCTCRQCGKSFALSMELFDALTRPARADDEPGQRGEPNCVGLMSFDYTHAMIPLDRLMDFMRKGFGSNYFTYNKTDHVLTIVGTGATLRAFSAENVAASQGFTYSDFFIDEAQNISDEVFFNLRPTLAVRRGKLMATGTPDIVPDNSWYYGLFLRGQEADEPAYFSNTLPCTLNPFGNEDDIREALSQLTEREFRMKYLGQWVDVEGQVFKNVPANFKTDLWLPEAVPGRYYGIGLDIAQSDDFTVAYAIDLRSKQIVDRMRFNGVSYAESGVPSRVIDMQRKWNAKWVRMDVTGVGKAVYDTLVELGCPVQPFTFTAKSKLELITKMQREIEKVRLILPAEDTVLKAELLAFRRVESKSGNIKYQAPVNFHDDCVMALGLAIDGALSGGVAISSSYLD